MAPSEIRSATPADLSALVQALGQEEFFSDRLRRQAGGKGRLLIARVDGRPVGDVYIWLEPAEEPELREHLPDVPLLIHLEVVEPLRRNGIGTAILDRAEAWLRRRGHRRVALGVTLDNGQAARLYERLGYVEWPHGIVKSTDEYRILVKHL